MSKWARHLTLSNEVLLRGPPHTHRRGPGPLRSGPKPTVCGSATGTHKVHPSGRIAFRLISGLFPARPSRLGSPIRRRGGLRTPASETSLSPGDRPIRPPGVPLPRMIMLCLGLRLGSECGRTECVPPRKAPPGHLRPSPQGHPGSDHQSRGGAGSARPEGRHTANPNVASFWLPARRQPIRWECLGSHPALPHGRGDRAPPRKPPTAPSPGFPRKAVLAWIAHPAEGRAPHARKESMTPTLTLPPFGYRLVVNPSGGNASARIRPCHTGAETAPLRENRPHRYPRVCPARPS